MLKQLLVNRKDSSEWQRVSLISSIRVIESREHSLYVRGEENTPSMNAAGIRVSSEVDC